LGFFVRFLSENRNDATSVAAAAARFFARFPQISRSVFRESGCSSPLQFLMHLATTKTRHVADAILSDISTSRLCNGDYIESKRKLTRVFGVSLGTVRRALEEMAHRGLLARDHGRCTLVTTSTRVGVAEDIVISIFVFLFLSLRNTDGTVFQGANSAALRH
jgi:hypothetical protein